MGGGTKSALTPDAIASIESARQALTTNWPFLEGEPGLDQGVRESAEQLADFLRQETFFRQLQNIAAARKIVEGEYQRRFREALRAKVEVYEQAFSKLTSTPGWASLSEDLQEQVATPLQRHAEDDGSDNSTISQLRADNDACTGRLHAAVEKVHRIVEGDRVVNVSIEPYFKDGVNDIEQLDAALKGLREECEPLLAPPSNKKIFIR